MRLKIENKTGISEDTKFLDAETGEPIYGVCKATVTYEYHKAVMAELEIEFIKNEHEGGDAIWSFRLPGTGEKVQVERVYFRRFDDEDDTMKGRRHQDFVDCSSIPFYEGEKEDG